MQQPPLPHEQSVQPQSGQAHEPEHSQLVPQSQPSPQHEAVLAETAGEKAQETAVNSTAETLVMSVDM